MPNGEQKKEEEILSWRREVTLNLRRAATRKRESLVLWDTGLGVREAESGSFVQSHQDTHLAQFKKMPDSKGPSTMELGHL